MIEPTKPVDPAGPEGVSPDYSPPEGRPGRTGFWLGCLGLLAVIALALAWQIVLPLWRRAQFLEELQKGKQATVLRALREYEAQRDPALERGIAASPWQPSQALARKILDTDSAVLHRALVTKGWRPQQRPSDRDLRKLAKLGPAAMPIMLIALQSTYGPANSYCAPAGEFLREHDPSFEQLAAAVKAAPKSYGTMLLAFPEELASQLGRKAMLAMLRPLLDNTDHARSSITANGKTYELRICDHVLGNVSKLAGPEAGFGKPSDLDRMVDPQAWQAEVQAAKDWWRRVEAGEATLDPELGFVRFHLRGVTTAGKDKKANILIKSEGPGGADDLNVDAGFQGHRYVDVAGPVAAGPWRVVVTDSGSQRRLERKLTVPAGGVAVFEGDFASAETEAEQAR